MTALRVGRSKIISNAIVPPSGHHFPPPLEQTVFPTVSYMRVFAKFEGDDLGKVVSLRYVNFTIFQWNFFVFRTIAFLEMCIKILE